ncbi:hypothetical protein HK16_06810 [Acetobacter senegalensis]|uniref:Uncharacterized protein n=1 Tax=Acetobacter senegalensis TaxID=446692 RepID=A0A252EKE1_9PROT|nr:MULTISPECIES: hypothetical protein [Acetobacter]OUL66910.1 hypothetical protein HK16_06810 [Acetobacter senegalensis]
MPFTKPALRKIQQRIDEKWTIEHMPKSLMLVSERFIAIFKTQQGLHHLSGSRSSPLPALAIYWRKQTFLSMKLRRATALARRPIFVSIAAPPSDFRQPATDTLSVITIQRPWTSYQGNLTRTLS